MLLAELSPPLYAEVIFRPKFSPSTYVDDNRRLRSEDDNRRLRSEDGSGLVASVNEFVLDGVFQRPTYSVAVAPRFRLIRNSSQKELNAEDYFFKVSAQKALERHQFAMEFGYDHEQSATTQLEESGQINA